MDNWLFHGHNKHSMTGPRETVSFVSPRSYLISVYRCEAEGIIEVVGKQNLLSPVGQVIE